MLRRAKGFLLSSLCWRVKPVIGGGRLCLMHMMKICNPNRVLQNYLIKDLPECIQSWEEEEFIKLTQESMSVAEYYGKFNEVACFAEYVIPGGYRIARKFTGGLRSEIWSKFLQCCWMLAVMFWSVPWLFGVRWRPRVPAIIAVCANVILEFVLSESAKEEYFFWFGRACKHLIFWIYECCLCQSRWSNWMQFN